MLEPIENQYLQIGHIGRSRGVDGEVVIIPRYDAPALFDHIEVLLLQNSRGDLVPARIESVRVADTPDRLSFFVKFEHVADRNQADALKDYPVYVEREVAEGLVEETGSATVDDFTTYDLFDEGDRRIGTVESVIDNPAHPILRIATVDDRQLLIPCVDEYIASIDEKEEIIRCRNLDQLEDL
ncbi:MAG: ribosome maturation factor RimM [Balneolaceae bacterium]|nr:ribosome maturation factor RimM [Balneolaceae bacterium]